MGLARVTVGRDSWTAIFAILALDALQWYESTSPTCLSSSPQARQEGCASSLMRQTGPPQPLP